MNRSPKPLHELIEAARAEASPMSTQDVSELVRSAPAPGSSLFGGHTMTPILVAATTALAALAGTYVILQSPPKPSTDPVKPQTASMVARSEGPSTVDPSTAPSQPALVSIVSEADPAGLCTGDLSLDYLTSLAELDIEKADQIDMCRSNDSMHITVVVNGKTRRTMVPIDDAPLPMMVTDAFGKGRCMGRVDAEADLNRLIPVESGSGPEKIIMWFSPTQAFMQALPDSLEQQMEGVMDMNVDVQMKDGNVRIRTQRKNSDGTRSEDVREMQIPDLTNLRDLPDMKDINAKLRIVMDSTNVMLKQLSTQMKDVNFNIDSMMRELRVCDTSVKKIRKQSIRIRTMLMSDRCNSIKAGIQELTRPSNGALSDATVFPNPATNGAATLSFSLRDDRTVSVALVDLSGTTVAELARSQRLSSGERQIPLTLNGVAAGMYVVRVQTEKGEVLAKRIIVE
ncbi:MAG: T9SS type A sorting domain-containing protein [Bacteroidetes bacterium]|nr:T9SS type A sorting domain-containing protein [Bacteroidota bacterium]